MPISDYVRRLRTKIDNDLLLVPTVSVLTFDELQRVLLVRPADSALWAAPGGTVQPYETPADAAVRGTWEQTGLTVELSRIIGVFGGMECSVTYANGDQESFTVVAFAARQVPDQTGTSAGQHTDAGMRRHAAAVPVQRYFNSHETADLPCYPHTAEMLRVAFAGDAAYFRPPRWRPPHNA